MQHRFVVDVNVGRLARWLRIMGYDALFPSERGDNELVRVALKESRTLVTRDSGIARRRAARLGQMQVVHIKDDDLRGQLRQLVRELKLDFKSGFTRCVCCNLALEQAAKEEVAARLPPYILATQCKFMRCPQCLRLYWRGTHWSNMKSEIERAISEAL